MLLLFIGKTKAFPEPPSVTISYISTGSHGHPCTNYWQREMKLLHFQIITTHSLGLEKGPIFLSFFKILFLEGGKRRRKERERSIDLLSLVSSQLGTWPATRAHALTGNQTSDLLVHRLMPNPLRHTSHGRIYLSWDQGNATLPSTNRCVITKWTKIDIWPKVGAEVYRNWEQIPELSV